MGVYDLKLGSSDSVVIAALPPGIYILDIVPDHKGVGLFEIYFAP